MVIHREGVLQFLRCRVLLDHVLLLIRAISTVAHRQFHLRSSLISSLFQLSLLSVPHGPTMSPRPCLGVQLVDTFPPYRVSREFALHFCRISALPFLFLFCVFTLLFPFLRTRTNAVSKVDSS